MFKLQVGDTCRLNEILESIYRKDDWKTGLYRVRRVSYGVGTLLSCRDDPEWQSYTFEKIKKDGTVYRHFLNGYNCLAWDKMIEDGKVTILEK